MRRGDIYWAAFHPSVGGEVLETRPAIVLSRRAVEGAIWASIGL